MLHRICNVKPLDNYLLSVSFVDGEVKNYDMKKLIDKEPGLASLVDYKVFSEVKVDVGGYGVSWNDEIDISAEELWDNGIEI